MTDVLQVTDTIALPRAELVYRASRSGGAGGQHVNTSSTRIELLWDFQRSTAIDDVQKARIRAKLGARIDSDGMLRIVAGNRRSQLQNRVAAEERLAILVRGAMHVAKNGARPGRPGRPKRSGSRARSCSRKRRRPAARTRSTSYRGDGESGWSGSFFQRSAVGALFIA